MSDLYKKQNPQDNRSEILLGRHLVKTFKYSHFIYYALHVSENNSIERKYF